MMITLDIPQGKLLAGLVVFWALCVLVNGSAVAGDIAAISRTAAVVDETTGDRTIYVRGDHNYPPYEYINDQGQPDGFNVDIIKAVAAAMGLNITIDLGPWDEVLAQLEKKEIDALIGMFQTNERDKKFDFSIPHFLASYAVFVRDGSAIQSIDDVKNKKILVQLGDLGHDYLRENNITREIIVKKDWSEVLKSLARGEGDCAIVSRLQGTRLIGRLSITNIMAVGSPILQRKYCLAVAEGNSALLAELNEGLSILKETGKYDEIYNKWFGVYAGQPPTLVKAFKNLIWIFLPLLALTIAGFLWSWTLKKQVNRRIIELRGELRERRRVEEALRTTNDLLSLFIKHSPIYAFIKEVSPTESRTLHASDNYRDMVGISGSAMAGKTMQEIFPAEFAAKLTADDWLVASGGEILRLDEDFNGRNYTTIKFPIVLGEKTLLAGYTIDITERKRTEDKLLQAQKMESIGRLAGGVAHDFNNMLGVILGYAEMTLDQVEAGTSIHSALQEIQQAARRSANLTRQLLAFARKQTVTPRILDLNTTVANMLNMLQRLIGEDIDLSWLPGENLGAVRIDPSQIDQILANLCVNARDALGYPGRITIETANVVADETYRAAHGYFVPGEYVRLAVSDNGCGMDRDTVSHLFEPFFTTKKIGDGTGLGLATTYGIVKQNNGFINVYSEPGLGTTFKIYLPCYPVKERQPSETVEAEAAVSGRETILLVEDEPMILQLSATMLNRLGYEVIAAGSPGEAIRLAEEHGGEIHLLMTDVVMPEMNGRDLARNLLSLYPDLKRLFMSGYTADIIAHHGVLDEGVNFIQKPFTFKDLSVKVREALDQA